MCLPIQLVVQQEIRKFRIVIFLLGAAENTKVAAVINAIFLDPLIIGQFDRTWIGLLLAIIGGVDQMIFIFF